MANRIITITKSDKHTGATYNDIALDGSIHYGTFTPEDEKDYLALLATEDYKNLIASDPDIHPLKIFFKKYKNRENYEEYLNSRNLKLKKLIDVKAVLNSIHNIFTWTPGERILNPEFGSNLRKYLYEGITDENQEKIMSEIRYSIQKWEPRAQLESVINIGTIDDVEDNTVHIQIVYSIPSLTLSTTYTYNYTLKIA